MIGHKWQRIAPISDVDDHSQLALMRLDNTARVWNYSKLELSDSAALDRFLGKLHRSISFETGIIEGLYEIDRGLTQTLVVQGFSRDAVGRAGESIPENTLQMLRDQLTSLDSIMDFIGGSRELSSAYIRELHFLITRSQSSYTAVDMFGQEVERKLMSGHYKTEPKNPTRQDGTVHEYSPVEQVASEMDRLVEMFNHGVADAHAIVASAWLHHRFVQIHPFQDGNGRVARALASIVLLRAELFPLHVRREDREDYLDALERADGGSLDSLVQLFAARERNDVLWAVSELARDAVAPVQGGRTADVAAAVAGQYVRKRHEVLEQRRQVNFVAEGLVVHGAEALADHLEEAREAFSTKSIPFSIGVDYGGSNDQRGHWWGFQIVEAAKRLNHWANIPESKYWIRSRITLADVKMRFVVSLHHVGSPVSGFMSAVAFAEIQYPETEPDDRQEQELVHCSDRAFTFTEHDAGEDLNRSFEDWLDEAQAVALRILGTAAI